MPAAWLGLGAYEGAAGGGGEITGEDGSVADLGEWGVIAALKARMPAGPLTSVGIGDDAAVVAAPSGSVVAAVDLLIEGRHFRRDWSSAYDVGVKAAARSLADIAAMGAVNTALLVALAAAGTLPARWATDLADGLAFEATRAGAGIVGGDTARADVVTLSVTASVCSSCTSLGVTVAEMRPGNVEPGSACAVAVTAWPTCTPRSLWILESTCIALRLWPPIAKKLSSRPTSVLSSSRQTPEMARSASLPGPRRSRRPWSLTSSIGGSAFLHLQPQPPALAGRLG